jgi:hypothetical protein
MNNAAEGSKNFIHGFNNHSCMLEDPPCQKCAFPDRPQNEPGEEHLPPPKKSKPRKAMPYSDVA